MPGANDTIEGPIFMKMGGIAGFLLFYTVGKLLVYYLIISRNREVQRFQK